MLMRQGCVAGRRIIQTKAPLLWSSCNYATNLPDYNTSVNVHEHRLKRPDKPPPKWKGLTGLRERSQGSLIPETLKQMETDEEFKITAANLKKHGQVKLTREERKKRQRALDSLGVPEFTDFWNMKKLELSLTDEEVTVRKRPVEILQLNIGIYCNQACNHCHVESSPKRKEMMSRQVADRCLQILEKSPTIHTVDVTGGAPELCDQFRHVVKTSADMGKEVIDRCNLTALLEPGQEDTAEFLAENRIRVVASLPCYTAKNVNLQRGSGVFDKSIQALVVLNELGYGKPGSGLQLDLVYNPLGAFLPPNQEELTMKYKEELLEHFGIDFNRLFTMTNMPIKRFADFLYRRNELKDYMELLVRNYNIDTVDKLMCRNVLSVDWTGAVFDCDFNQQLLLPLRKDPSQSGLTVYDIENADEVVNLKVATDNHCFGCTSGMGSS